MKILFVHNIYKPYYRGGAEVVALNLVAGIKDRGDEPVVISLGYKNEIETIDGIKVYRVKPVNVLNYLEINKKPLWLRTVFHFLDLFNDFTPWKILKIAQAEKPDFIFLQGIKGLGYVTPRLLKAFGFKVSIRVFDLQYIHPSGLLAKKYNRTVVRLWSFFCRLMLGPIDYVIFPSDYIKKTYVKFGFFGKSRVQVIANPLPPDISFTIKNRKHNKVKNFIYLGQAEKYKGLGDLLEALLAIKDDYVLHVVGEGNDLNELKRLAVDDPRINFYGQKNQEFLLQEIWPKADLLINPSRVEESFGMVVIEAYANGVPVIASDIGALSGLVKEGETGWLIRPGDVTQLKYKLQNIIAGNIDLAPFKKRCVDEARQYSVSNYLNKFYEFVDLKK